MDSILRSVNDTSLCHYSGQKHAGMRVFGVLWESTSGRSENLMPRTCGAFSLGRCAAVIGRTQSSDWKNLYTCLRRQLLTQKRQTLITYYMEINDHESLNQILNRRFKNNHTCYLTFLSKIRNRHVAYIHIWLLLSTTQNMRSLLIQADKTS